MLDTEEPAAVRPDPDLTAPSSSSAGVSAEVQRENNRWLRGLAAPGSEGDHTTRELYELLLRVARLEVHRRSARLGVSGQELDDLAHQAAADSMLAIADRLETFRGECKFTTWAYKFVIFQVCGKVNRHFWRHANIGYEQDDWERRPSDNEPGPDAALEAQDLMAAVRHAVQHALSERQRTVFVAVVFNNEPIDEVATRLHAKPNAIYKVLFDARRKLRTALATSGHLPERPCRPAERDTLARQETQSCPAP